MVRYPYGWSHFCDKADSHCIGICCAVAIPSPYELSFIRSSMSDGLQLLSKVASGFAKAAGEANRELY